MKMKKKYIQTTDSYETRIRTQQLSLIQNIAMIFLSLSIIILLLMK